MQPEQKPAKPQAKPREQTTPHPETLKTDRGLPGEESSKATPGVPGAPQHDGRTGNDKDGNEEQSRPGRHP
jgi:hypothetical protein